jgi:hypothetical protein
MTLSSPFSDVELGRDSQREDTSYDGSDGGRARPV